MSELEQDALLNRAKELVQEFVGDRERLKALIFLMAYQVLVDDFENELAHRVIDDLGLPADIRSFVNSSAQHVQ